MAMQQTKAREKSLKASAMQEPAGDSLEKITGYAKSLIESIGQLEYELFTIKHYSSLGREAKEVIGAESFEFAKSMLEEIASAGYDDYVARLQWQEKYIRQRGAHEWEPLDRTYYTEDVRTHYVPGTGMPIVAEKIRKEAKDLFQKAKGLQKELGSFKYASAEGKTAKVLTLGIAIEGLLTRQLDYIYSLYAKI